MKLTTRQAKALLNSGYINRQAVAEKMFPKLLPKSAVNKLYRKLGGEDSQFNGHDTKALNEILSHYENN